VRVRRGPKTVVTTPVTPDIDATYDTLSLRSEAWNG
jgi:hypothetical protein